MPDGSLLGPDLDHYASGPAQPIGHSAHVTYCLPDGRAVHVPFVLCRAASTVDYTLADGRIVLAVIQRGQR